MVFLRALQIFILELKSVPHLGHQLLKTWRGRCYWKQWLVVLVSLLVSPGMWVFCRNTPVWQLHHGNQTHAFIDPQPHKANELCPNALCLGSDNSPITRCALAFGCELFNTRFRHFPFFWCLQALPYRRTSITQVLPFLNYPFKQRTNLLPRAIFGDDTWHEWTTHSHILTHSLQVFPRLVNLLCHLPWQKAVCCKPTF